MLYYLYFPFIYLTANFCSNYKAHKATVFSLHVCPILFKNAKLINSYRIFNCSFVIKLFYSLVFGILVLALLLIDNN